LTVSYLNNSSKQLNLQDICEALKFVFDTGTPTVNYISTRPETKFLRFFRHFHFLGIEKLQKLLMNTTNIPTKSNYKNSK